MPKIRVLVVDDSAVMRKLIAGVLDSDTQISVVGLAANGKIALERIPQVNPDLVTLDVDMPEMEGLATLSEIRKIYPKLPVIMVSALTTTGAITSVKALASGASDYITKPSGSDIATSIERLAEQLIPKVKMLCRHMVRNEVVSDRGTRPVRGLVCVKHSRSEIVCVGVSTGGPNALVEVFSRIVQPLPVPIVIVQHMPPMFTRALADRLNTIGSSVRFHEGEEGMTVEAGHAYIAPGGKHMDVRREAGRVVVKLHEGPPENSCRPAADVLFRSVVAAYGGAVLGVVLTGMGQDGLRGCELIAEAGGRIVIQDESTSVVWGMPGFVARAGLANEILPITQMGPKIVHILLAQSERIGARPATTFNPTN